jgi:molybdopterin-containing oxidoreductase family iron-sulfur binding subunit
MDSVDGVNGKGVQGKCGAEAAHRPEESAGLDLEQVRARLREKKGPEFWRSLDELAATPEFADLLHREFPRHASEWPEGVSRRNFMQLAGASLALAGLTGCTKQPIEKIVPYVRQPEQVIPGRPLFFATALTHAGYAMGVLAESHLGRPTKIEGNPDHPASLGATDTYAQAALLCLYDPDRSQVVTHNGRTGTWSGFVSEVNSGLRARQPLGGEGLRILSGSVTSPTLAAQIRDLLSRFPRARWHRWEPAGNHQGAMAAQRAFGRPVAMRFDFSRADVVVAIESDALTQGPASVRYQRDFSARRRVRGGQTQAMNRVYCVESVPTSTATVSDHRLRLPPAEVEAFVLALAQALGVGGGGAAAALPSSPDNKAQRFLAELVADLRARPAGTTLVYGGEELSPGAQVLIHAINQALGNLGTTVVTTDPVEVDPVDQVASLRTLVADMNAGRVDMLLLLGGVNPVYTAPADFGFAQALQKVELRIHHGLYTDETSEYCHWHIPAAHELESWGDARSFDGTVSLIQPLIDPLFDGKSESEVLAAFTDRPDTSGHDILQAFWKAQLPGDFAAAWRAVLHDGLVPNSALPPVAVGVNGGAAEQAAAEVMAALQQARALKDRITLLFRPDPTIYDGRYASNAWLQELPKPLTKLVWDNALVLAPATAERLGLRVEETVEVTVGGRKAPAAVWILPGQAEDTAVLTLGYGRTRLGHLDGSGREDVGLKSALSRGFNAYALRASNTLWAAPAEIRRIGERYQFACTQNHHALDPQGNEDRVASEEAERREVIRKTTAAELAKDVAVIQNHRERPGEHESMYPAYDYSGVHAWGMAIDLSVCTGCSSCVVACQAENNIPVVGKDQVLAGREMHWLRIDRYFEGDFDDPSIHNQPIPCMHCETAPCEVVCPVAATSHSSEGLNDMVYNRCVGTRYCSNNCPYKVRRFNFLRYSDRESPLAAMMYNPDVTVRMRGVMEKCTYCVQRIEQAKIEAKVDDPAGRAMVPANKLQTACQQACPTHAIVFGDIHDEAWEVTQWKKDPLSYGLLEELNTRPRTTYLAKVSNPNPRLAAAEGSATATERTEHGHS